MIIFPIIVSEDNGLIAFEIDNIYVGKTKIASILATVKNVTHLKIRKPFSNEAEVLIWFEYEGEQFIVWEPYGDSSRYWIGPEKPDNFLGDIKSIADKIKAYEPTFLRKIIGAMLTLNLRNS